MSGLDLEGVLRAHYLHGYACGDDCTYVVNSAGGWAAHVAAVLREQIDGALAEAWDEGWNSAAWRSYKRTGIAIDNATEARSHNPAPEPEHE